MNAVAQDFRQERGEVGADRGLAQRGVAADHLQHVFHHGIDFKRLLVQLAFAEQGAHPPDHLAGALVVFANVGEDVAQLAEGRRVLLEEQLRRFGVGEDGGQRLVQLVRHGRGQFAHGGHAGDVRQFCPLTRHLGFGQLALGNVHGYTARENGFAVTIELDTTARADPTQPTVRQHHAIFRLVVAVAFRRHSQGPADHFAVFGVELLQKVIKINPLRLRKPQQRAPFVGRPDFAPFEVTDPDAQVRGLGG